jgi:shikimate kinase
LPSFPGIADTAEIGQILADRRGWLFFNLDDEIERHFGTSIERLQYRRRHRRPARP